MRLFPRIINKKLRMEPFAHQPSLHIGKGGYNRINAAIFYRSAQ